MNLRSRLIATTLAAAVALALGVRPSAAVNVLDLTTAGSSGTIGNGFFKQINDQSTGTGVIDPFVRIQTNQNTEAGFNSDYRPTNGDLSQVNNSAQFTHSIFVNQFGVVDNNGTPSIRFLLDINQTGNEPLLSLDQLRVYVADTPDIHQNSVLFAKTLIYDMDATADNRIHLNYSLNSGQGSGDMLAYLPVSLFNGYQNKYLYLYSQFGAEGGHYVNNANFEEWARIDGAPPTGVPEPKTVVLLGVGLLAAAIARRNVI